MSDTPRDQRNHQWGIGRRIDPISFWEVSYDLQNVLNIYIYHYTYTVADIHILTLEIFLSPQEGQEEAKKLLAELQKDFVTKCRKGHPGPSLGVFDLA